MAKEILSKFDDATILQALNRDIPDLQINSIVIIETGWDHLVAEVNQEWIFRFPRAKESIANLEREKSLLTYLKGHISLPVPHYQFFGANIAFIGYQKLPGIHLNQQIYKSLDPQIQHDVAKTLATFFTELHHAVSKEQAKQWGYGPIIRPLSQMESELLSILPHDIRTMLKEAIDYAREDLSKEENLVFVHQDVNGDNLAFDLTSGQITGIFDFSDTAIGPYSWEFAELFVVDIKLARLTAEIYSQINNVKDPLIGGATDYVLRKATLMIEAEKLGYLLNKENLLQGLKDFLPIWHEVTSKAAI